MRIKKAGILIIAAAITCTTPAVPMMAADTSESVQEIISDNEIDSLVSDPDKVVDIIMYVKNEAAKQDISDDQIRSLIQTAESTAGVSLSEEEENRIIKIVKQIKDSDIDEEQLRSAVTKAYDKLDQIRSAANKRNLKDSTIHAYCTSVAHFLNHTAKDIDALTTDDVDIFLTEKKLSGISPETYNHYHSGIRFFYKKILKKNWDDDDIPRMKRDRKLPTVLTKAEISAILDATPNLKHKAMIATMYSGGLRVSEVTHLHYDDISRTNKTIHIRDGKSRSDRYTLLADRTLEILTEYWFQCGRPRGILFPSSWTGDYLTKDSVIQFFRESAKRAGIQKHVSTHCLRHSFASHLFESGCDVKYIQALLGHRDPKSTEVYLHVSNKTLLGIRSPFDEMGGE